MAAAMRELLNVWEHYRVVADEYRELDEQRILVILHAGGRGKTSALKLASATERGANVFHVRAGRVTRLVVYFVLDLAFADLGLKG